MSRTLGVLLAVAAAAGALGCGSDDAVSRSVPCFCSWRDYGKNPLIEAPKTNVVGDPTFLLPADTPDGRWHLFAYTPAGIFQFLSDDGLAWEAEADPVVLGFRPYVLADGGKFHLFYQKYDTPAQAHLEVMSSDDLSSFTTPTTVLDATLPWEGELSDGVVSNPFVTRRDGEYWLYYSADQVLLDDSGVYEPRYLSVAHSPNLTGPYQKHGTPLLSPGSKDPYFNLGVGSLKTFAEPWQGRTVGFANGIYRDDDGATHSAIHLLVSDDGLEWNRLCSAPIITPSGRDDWKRAYAYAFDAKRNGNEIWLYYNARDGWTNASEHIGLARLGITKSLDDMQACGSAQVTGTGGATGSGTDAGDAGGDSG